jgi:hypothetical protein
MSDRIRFTCFSGAWRLGRRTTFLESYMLDDKAIKLFTNGHCHSFALAMHKLTGWALVCQYGSPYHGNERRHMYVLDPRTGYAVDAGDEYIMDDDCRVLKHVPKFNERWLPLQADDALTFAKMRLMGLGYYNREAAA